MNFSGPFDAGLAHDSPVSLGGERFSFDSKPGFVQHHASDSQIVVPDAHLLFSGDYTRIGSDLIISGDGQKFVVGNYFKGETRPVLTTKDGATLAGHIVDALTGHVHYAQATAPAQAGQIIGHVQKMSGSATVIRNGVSVELRTGDAVQKGDVVQTGSDSSISMTFVDGSVFGMTSSARMVLNEMIFDPNGSSNSSLISLVQGTITFVAGQTAKNGNMRVETPVATMGIRGTAVLVEIGANDGPTKFSVLVEPDGHTGSYNLYDKTTGQLIGTVSQAGQVTYVSVSGIGQAPTAIEQLKTLADQEAAKTLIQEVFKLYFPNYNPDNSNPKSQKTGFSSPGDNINPFAFYKPLQDAGPQKVITVPGVGVDPVTGQPNPPRTFYNTKAQFSALSVFADQAFSPTIRVFSFNDVVKIDDPDIGNAPFYDIGVPFVAGSAIIKSAVSTVGYLSEAFLKPLLNINQTTGVVSFDREQFNFLDDGQTVTFKIQVTATSGPDTGIVEIPITITGANDAPTIVVGAATIITGAVKEDVAITSGHIETNGTITFQDVDLTDAHTASAVLTSTSSTLHGFVSGAGNAPTTTKIGTFTIDPVSESTTDTNNHGSVGWHFTLDDNDPTLQSLAEGQTITQIYTITITDDNGVPVTQTVTITITGTNDAPVLAADTTLVHTAEEVINTTNSSVEDVVNGTLTFADVDLSDTHEASAALHPGSTSVVWSGGAYSGIPSATLAALGTAMKTVVTDSTGTGSGSVAWEFKLPDHLFDFLAHGETLTLIYDVILTDNNGVSSTQQVTVVVEAANDQPVISVIDNSGAVQEDFSVAAGNLLKDTGSVTFTDTDLTDTHTAHVVYNNDATGAPVSTALAAALATALTVPSATLAAGNHSFSWNFALDNGLIQNLAQGETITVSYTITVQDASNASDDTSAGQVVTVTITGTNDAPTIASVSTPALVDTAVSDTFSTLAGTLVGTDIDNGETSGLTYAALDGAAYVNTPVVGQYGTLTVNSAGTYTYVPNAAAINALHAGNYTDIFTVQTTDVHGATGTATFTVNVTGANDAPTVAAVTTSVIDTAANDTFVTQTGSLVGTDLDTGETSGLTYAALDGAAYVNTPVVGQYGTLTVNNTGTYSYVPNAAAINALSAGNYTDTFTVQTSDVHGATGTATFTVNVTGANDTPTVAAALTINTTEGDAPVVRDLLQGATDVDTGETASLTVSNIRYSIDNGTETTTTPHGITFPDGHTINIDAAGIQHIPAGVIETIEVRYDVTDIHGATVAQTETISVTGVNDRPVLAAGTDFTTITEDQTANAGQLVSSFATGISDPDDGALKGVAITGYTSQNGHWEYSIDSGSSWSPFTTYSSGSGLLLASNDLVRFVPNGENGGADTLTYVAWDQTSGTHGQSVNTMVPGHTAAFSEDSQTASLIVASVNDAPHIDTSSVQISTSGGNTLISGAAIVDPDTGDGFNISLIASSGSVAGTLDSMTYTPPGSPPQTATIAATVSDIAGASDKVNFIFNVSGTGPVTLQGTSDKDVFLATSYQDTFVFAPSSNQDVITNGFQSGTDKIDLQAFSSIDATALADILANAGHTGGDTLLHFNGTTDTVLLKGVAALNASDFILHA